MQPLRIRNSDLLRKFLSEQNRTYDTIQDGWCLSIPITSNEDTFLLGLKFGEFCSRLENRLVTIGELEKSGLLPEA